MMNSTILLEEDLELPDRVPLLKSACLRAGMVFGAVASEEAIDHLAKELHCSMDIARRAAWMAGVRPEPAAAIILIGGKSIRMGMDKSLLMFDGMSAAERLFHILTPHFDDVFFAGAHSQSSPVPETRCVHDSVEGKGPLAGLAAGLSATLCRVNFVIACDIPEIDFFLMRRLLSYLERYEIAAPAFSTRRTEPLFGAYDRCVGATANRLVHEGSLKVINVYDYHKTNIIPAADSGWYTNLNTPDDLFQYRKRSKSESGPSSD